MLFHIDTDLGVDDALALVLAQRLLGGRLASLSTVFGNVPLAQATFNTRLLRRLLGRAGDLPVWQGAAGPMTTGAALEATQVHGDDGLGGATADLPPDLLAALAAEPPAPDLVALPPRAATEPVCLIALGPATNLPRLVELFGRDRVARVVWMGGAVLDPGNVTAAAEFNAAADPEAMAWLLGAGLPLTLVPLDLCRKLQLTRPAVEAALAPRPGPLARLLLAAHRRYIAHYEDWEGFAGCFPHDSVAVCVAARPGHFPPIDMTLAAELAGAERGRTRAVALGGPVRVALGGDLRWVRRELAATLAAA